MPPPLLCSACTDRGNVVHEPSRNKESPSLLRIESLPISAFIRSRFGLKRLVKFTEQGVPWLLAASRFQPGKNAGCLAVGSPSACGHQGAAQAVVGKAAAARVGCYCRSAAQFGESPQPLAFGLTHTPPGVATPVLRWAPAARPSADLGEILRPMGWALSETKAWPLPGPIKPPAFPAFIVSGVAN